MKGMRVIGFSRKQLLWEHEQEEGESRSKEVSSCRDTQSSREGTDWRSDTNLFLRRKKNILTPIYVYIIPRELLVWFAKKSLSFWIFWWLCHISFIYFVGTKAQDKREVEDPATARSRVRRQGRTLCAPICLYTVQIYTYYALNHDQSLIFVCLLEPTIDPVTFFRATKPQLWSRPSGTSSHCSNKSRQCRRRRLAGATAWSHHQQFTQSCRRRRHRTCHRAPLWPPPAGLAPAVLAMAARGIVRPPPRSIRRWSLPSSGA